MIGIELLAAAQGCDFHAPLTSSEPLEAVRALAARARCRISTTTAISIPTWKRPIELVRSGAVIAAAGAVGLPDVAGASALPDVAGEVR